MKGSPGVTGGRHKWGGVSQHPVLEESALA